MVGIMSAVSGMSRRNFVAGAVGAGVVASAMSYKALAEESQSADEAAAPYAERVSSTMDTDIVVVGAGISGLSAAVQAAEGGAGVILLESGTALGGNGTGTEGMFGVNSSLQQEQGIEISFAEIINEELDFFAYKIDPSFWRDLYDYSGANLDWLRDNGVKFSGVVDNYGVGRVETFHWYDGTAVECYIEPMKAKADECGVQTLLETRGRELIQDEAGTVVGIYAEGADGSVVQINAKAVILATGGFAGSPEKMKEHGIVLGSALLNGSTTNVGDGLDMAVAAGAYDRSYECCYLTNAMTPGFTFFLSLRVGMLNTALWVNRDGVRYTNENCGAVVQANAANAVRTQFESFIIADQPIIDAAHEVFTGEDFDFKGELESLLEEGAEGVFRAETLPELAAAAGIDEEAFAQTVERYNGYCASGVDEDFSKEAEYLQTIDEGPFYAIKQMDCYGTSMGGVLVNRNYQALTIDREPIPGLYAVGTDGCMMYYGTYTIEVPSSIGGHNVNSARIAANHALSTL